MYFFELTTTFLRILPKQNTALLSTVRVCVSQAWHIKFSHIYNGINAMLIIRGPIKPYIFWIKIILAIFLAKTRPDKTNFSALTNLTIDFGAESALFTLSCVWLVWYSWFSKSSSLETEEVLVDRQVGVVAIIFIRAVLTVVSEKLNIQAITYSSNITSCL